jgi:hypothetical protein
VADDAVLNNVLEKEYFTVRKANIGFVDWMNGYQFSVSFYFLAGYLCWPLLRLFIIRGMEGSATMVPRPLSSRTLGWGSNL